MSELDKNALLRIKPPNTQLVGSRIIVCEETTSTNDLALEHGGDGVVYVAERQKTGRGRRGRMWHSAPGRGLWFSVALSGKPEGIAFASTLAVRDALAPWCSLSIKWPNDLLLNGHKVCGILLEHKNARTAVGIGINVLHDAEDFPNELRTKATSLFIELGCRLDRSEILSAVLVQLDRRLLELRHGEYETIRNEWAVACNLLGRRIRAGAIEGQVISIDMGGALILDSPQGAHRLDSGDITILSGV